MRFLYSVNFLKANGLSQGSTEKKQNQEKYIQHLQIYRKKVPKASVETG